MVHVNRDVVFEEDKGWVWKDDTEMQVEVRGTFVVTSTSTRDARSVI